MTHNELAARIERAEGPDRALDAEIALATGQFFLAEPRYPGAERMYGYIDENGRRVEPGNGGQYSLIPSYTASIDAAMQLAEGQRVILNIAEDGITTAIVGGWQGCADSPALALCAAAIRARSAS